jgi:hypothetical protein
MSRRTILLREAVRRLAFRLRPPLKRLPQEGPHQLETLPLPQMDQWHAGRSIHPQDRQNPQLGESRRVEAKLGGSGESQEGLSRSQLNRRSRPIWSTRRLANFGRLYFISWKLSSGSSFSLPLLRDYRATWTDGALAKKKKQKRLIGFIWFCVRAGWLPSNLTQGLGRISVDPTPTDYFTQDEFKKTLDAT